MTTAPQTQPPRRLGAVGSWAACDRHGPAFRRRSRPDLVPLGSLRSKSAERSAEESIDSLVFPLPRALRPAQTASTRRRRERKKVNHERGLSRMTTNGSCRSGLLPLARRRPAARRAYRRLWTSILISSFGGQVTMLALPLTAAVLLHATPDADGPADRDGDRCRSCCSRCRRASGSTASASCRSTSPASCTLGVVGRQRAARLVARLAVDRLAVRRAASCIGTVYTVAGSAAQIVLTQVVPRERLVEAHAKNALATSGAEVAGPGLAGALIKVVGAPLALLVDAVLLTFSARDPARHRRSTSRRRGAPRGAPMRAVLARPARPACASSRATGCWSRWRSRSAPGRRATTPRSSCRSCSRRARSACRSRRSASATSAWASAPIARERVRQPHQPPHRPGPVPGARLRDLRRRLAAARGGAGQRLGRRRVRADADAVLDRRGADLHQLPGAAPGRDAGAAARPHDEHDALADPDPGRARARCSAAGSASTSACARRSRSPAAARCCSPVAAGARRDPAACASCREPERDDDWLGAEADVRRRAVATT